MTTIPQDRYVTLDGIRGMSALIVAAPHLNDRIESIQALRAIAALFVVTLHTFGLARQSGYAAPPPFGAFGVDIFFVISGFVMVLTTQRQPSVRNFVEHRLERVVPLYWLLTTVKAVLMLAVPAMGALKFSWPHVVTSYAFLPWYNQLGEPHPVLYVGWSLTYELWFYAIFASFRFQTTRVALACLALALLGQLSGPLVWDTLTDALLLEFVMGMALGLAFLRKSWFAPAIIAGAVVLFPEHRAFYWGVPATGLVGVCLLIERWWPKTILSRIGDSSYSLYLTHIFVLPFYFRLVPHIPGLPNVLATLGAFVAAIVVGHVTHLIVERPVLDLFRKRRAGKSSERQSVNAEPA